MDTIGTGDVRSRPACQPTDQPPPTSHAAAGGHAAVLSHNVLVLNKFYQAIRVINVRRAFSLLCRELAEVVHIETDAKGQSKWQNLDFDDWHGAVSQLKAEFEPDEFDWIHTVRFQIAVPRIIRLLGYDKLPRQDVKFNRRNIYARDGNKLPVLRQEDADDRAVARPRASPRARAARARGRTSSAAA